MTTDSLNDCSCPKIPGGIIEVNWQGRIPICCKCKGAVVPPKPELKRGEISDTPEAIALRKILDALGIAYEAININSIGLFEGWIRNAHKPVTVEAFSKAFGASVDKRMLGTGLHGHIPHPDDVMAGFKAAGVKYVD